MSFSQPGEYTFTVDDLELMAELDLKIFFIESRFLRTERESSKLLEFAEVLKKMKYLEQFFFSCEEFDHTTYDYAPIELLTDLPFKYLFSGNFEFEKGNFEDIANTLSQIKTLVQKKINYHLMNLLCLRIYL